MGSPPDSAEQARAIDPPVEAARRSDAVRTSRAEVRLEAPVMEVFASVQGEGLYVGEPQSFLRLFGCPLRCRYCDTPGSWTFAPAMRRASFLELDEGQALEASSLGPKARVRGPGGSVRRESSLATPFQAACWIAEVEPGGPRTVSVTGGEPLMWPEFVLALPGFLGERRLHLETAGGHPAALERVLDAVDHVSLDLKLPADLDLPTQPPRFAFEAETARAAGTEHGAPDATPSNEAEWARARREDLALVRGRDACGKLVVTGECDAEEYTPLLADVAELAPELPLFLQPATPMRQDRAPDPELVVEVLEAARDRGLNVRVVPQIHRMMRVP